MDTMAYLYVYLQRDMDPHVERTGTALLCKISASSNAFIKLAANKALESLVQYCSPNRVLTTLLNTGQR